MGKENSLTPPNEANPIKQSIFLWLWLKDKVTILQFSLELFKAPIKNRHEGIKNFKIL